MESWSQSHDEGKMVVEDTDTFAAVVLAAAVAADVVTTAVDVETTVALTDSDCPDKELL